jgi:hypothetical protein
VQDGLLKYENFVKLYLTTEDMPKLIEMFFRN